MSCMPKESYPPVITLQDRPRIHRQRGPGPLRSWKFWVALHLGPPQKGETPGVPSGNDCYTAIENG